MWTIKNKKIIQTFKETGDRSYIYKKELDKACLQHDMAYGDFKDVKRRTGSDKIIRDKAFYIAKNPKYDGYQRGIASMVYKFFDKKSSGRSRPLPSAPLIVNIDTKQNLQLAKELHKPIIKK